MSQEQIRKTTRKVIKKTVHRLGGQSSAVPKEPERQTVRESSDSHRGEVRTKRTCYFCESKTIPSYTDIATLRKFLTERSKIVSKLRSGACSKHQRRITTQIKYARFLALLPFTPRV